MSHKHHEWDQWWQVCTKCAKPYADYVNEYERAVWQGEGVPQCTERHVAVQRAVGLRK